MIVRTYGRRSREISRTYSDGSNPDDVVSDDSCRDSYSLSQETTQGLYNWQFLSSQDSSSLWSSQEDHHNSSSFPDLSPTRTQFDAAENGPVKRSKKQKKGFSEPLIPPTSTLMEAQEFGEMMEHVDEVNFAIDGLRKGSQVRIRRASLLSLLSVCGTVQQRRLLRSHGMAKTIVDAILGLSFDDPSSNLAAAALLFVLTGDSQGQDDYLLESHSCIRFMIRLLKPAISGDTEQKSRKIGSKLLAIRKEADIFRDINKALDSSASIILSKVQEILISCKELKSIHGDDSGISRPELNPKWIALLTMEKACLSKISLEDATGTVRKHGGNFKEKLRELGGLDAVYEVAMDCYFDLKGLAGKSSASASDGKQSQEQQSLLLLLKCLKIMENATFLSEDNQSHLLGINRNSDSHGSRPSFMKLMINVIKILSDLSLSSSATSNDEKSLVANNKDKNKEVVVISSSENSFDPYENNSFSTDHLGFSESNCETTTMSMDGNCFLNMRSRSSLSSSCSGPLRSSNGGNMSKNGSRSKFSHLERLNSNKKVDKCVVLEDSEDPFAFDEDAFEPSKWDLLSGKGKQSKTKRREKTYIDLEDEDLLQCPTATNQQESSSKKHFQQLFSNGLEQRCSQESSCSHANDKERSTLLADCLLTTVKVLMNLTNDNPIGCEQVAACGGMETMSSLIASHFPEFGLPLPLVSNGVKVDHQELLNDEEVDFLVATLGLLVNLVEKDGRNRSLLAAARVALPNSEGLEDENQRDLIPLLCSIFLANRGAGDATDEEDVEQWDEIALQQGAKEAEKMIVAAYAALLLAFLSTESSTVRAAIAECLPDRNLVTLVPVIEKFVAFHRSLNMISTETHKAVSEVIESCKAP